MSARRKLNAGYFLGSLAVAGIVGGLAGSWGVFLVAATILVAMNCYNHEIRPGTPWR